MSDEKPDPLSDVIRGLGLLLRAAKTTVERVPKKGLEDAVLETAREVGRAIENVAGTVEREVFGRRDGRDAPTRGRTDGTRKDDPTGANRANGGEEGDEAEGDKGDEDPPRPPTPPDAR